jgi:hypothetical protein
MATNQPEDDERLYAHLLTLLSVSAAMVGVSLTAIGLVSVIEAVKEVEHVVDDLLAISTLIFSVVTLLSFLGIRTRVRRSWPKYMLVLDITFCVGIATLVIASLLMTFVVI